MSGRREHSAAGLLDRRAGDRARYLIFTSAGDHANLKCWLRGRKNFDLWITYYGDEPRRYENQADIYNARKGSKFQNLKFAHETWPDLFASYEAVMVMDDDLLITGRGLSMLFELRERMDLWLLQPAFCPRGKISIPITRVQWRYDLRYTDYVEMGSPLFRRDKLDAFMAVYDPVLVGYGTEWWFLDVLGPALEGKVAIVDRITCVNPHDRTKGGVREIDRLQPTPLRIATWREVKQKWGIRADEAVQREFGGVLKPAVRRWSAGLVALGEETYLLARSVAGSLKRCLLKL